MSPKKFIYNNQKFKERRRELRKNQTRVEGILWQHIRGGKLNGFKFYRQYSVGPYILDFYCPKIRLTIELDGKSHESKDAENYDQERTDYLYNNDIKEIRFKNVEVLENVRGVIEKISLLLR